LNQILESAMAQASSCFVALDPVKCYFIQLLWPTSIQQSISNSLKISRVFIFQGQFNVVLQNSLYSCSAACVYNLALLCDAVVIRPIFWSTTRVKGQFHEHLTHNKVLHKGPWLPNTRMRSRCEFRSRHHTHWVRC